MFEEMTYENLLQDVLDNAPEEIDTRQGSIFYDAVSGILLKIAKMYTDLELVFSLSQLSTATGEYLDARASEYGITRHDAVKARFHTIFEGAVPETGERFFSDGMYFTLVNDNGLLLEAEETGTQCNNIPVGTAAVPVDTIEGLSKSAFGAISEYGAESEDDESLRRRVFEKIAGSGENGNKAHYKRWCESIDGVGKARIFPLWNGENTVKAVLISYDGLPCTDDTVIEVQEYIDPGGTGLGEGTANLGAHFTAVKAAQDTVDIAVSIEPESGADTAAIAQQLESAVKGYFKTQVMTAAEDEVTIRCSGIGAVISAIPGVVDYSGLMLNGGSANISSDAYSVPVPGAVNVEFT